MKNKDIFHRHAIYTAGIESMRQYMSAYLADEDFIRQVRPRRASEDDKLYRDTINNTYVVPLARHVVDRIVETVFETGVSRNLAFINRPGGTSVPTPDWAHLMIMDADYSNTSMSGFMQSAATTASIFGYTYIFVDKPSDDPLGRPYCQNIDPTRVWDWNYTSVQGRPVLSHIKICEWSDDTRAQVVVYTAGNGEVNTTWSRYLADADPAAELRPAELISSGEIPGGLRIPAFILHARPDPRRADIGISDISAASRAMREHYVLECEAYQSSIFSKTLLRVAPGIKSVPVHAGGLVRGQPGDIEAININTGDIQSLGDRQDAIITSLSDMSGLSGLRMNKTAAESGISIIESRRSLYNTASARATKLEAAEQMILSIAAAFQGITFAGEIKYDTNYSGADTSYRLALMREARALSPDNLVIKGLVENELIQMLSMMEPEPVLGDDQLLYNPESGNTATDYSDEMINKNSYNIEQVSGSYDTNTAIVLALKNEI